MEILEKIAIQLWGKKVEEWTLPKLLIQQLRRRGGETVVTDSFLENRSLTGFQALTVGFLFAKWMELRVPEKRIGIVLPPGFGATVVNLACVLCGKIPVNLNFTAGKISSEASIRKAEIQSIFTVQAFRDKFPDFPWGDQVYDIKPIFVSFTKIQKLLTFLKIRFLGDAWVDSQFHRSTQLSSDEAAILFTSGSSGEPKGVVLTHANIISNVLQIQNALGSLHLQSMLGSLPIFHSFGFTVTLWWPLLGGPRVITYPSPTETVALAQVIEAHQIELLLSTPTFLRSFLKRAERKQFRSLKMVVTGAEKLPSSLTESFASKFNISLCEGYGMTEASPVVSVNLLDDSGASGDRREVGTVGRLLQGIQVQIRDQDTDQILTSGVGMIWIQGPNLFPGYLHEEKKTAEVLVNGWYKTGDLGYVNERGFLVIEGRLSRFSKMAGEMVPHGVIEEKIGELFKEVQGETWEFAVAGIPDEIKGESLLLLTTQEVDLDSLRKKLLSQGIPALWIPKRQGVVEKIPTLASGKLDLRALRELAFQIHKN